jgi:hypothetical protein
MPPKRKDTAKKNGLPLLPDPSRDPDAIKLGTLAFPVKVGDMVLTMLLAAADYPV